MAYRRQISYFDLTENKMKRGNAGFVKWEKYDECHILSVFVTGLEPAYSNEVLVKLDRGITIGKLNIKHGRGEGTYLLTKGEEKWVEDIRRLFIFLEEEKELSAEFDDIGKAAEVKKEDVFPQAEEREEKTEEDRAEESVDAFTEEKTEALIPIQEKDFWQILGETHELFYPFENNVGCFRIFPKDIRSFHAKYHGLGSNQFLMHGYYNYRHLIILPKKEGENEFWLGVPGIYHEREKMAAGMHGFEKFEGTKNNYKAGDLGYYLITVEGQ